jgi:hypothetical protein
MKKRIGFWLLLFVALFCTLRGAPYDDITEAVYKRSQQYSLGGYKKIVVFSPQRTGSTLVFNILRFLFENIEVINQSTWANSRPDFLVNKTHEPKLWGKKTIVFCTIRNPVDAIFSFYRVLKGDKPFLDISYLNVLVDFYIEYLRNARRQIKMENTVLLRYEDFERDMGHIFQKVEEALGIQIDLTDKELMKRVLSIENVSLHIQQYQGFDQYDSVTHFHGAHIDQGELTPKEKGFLVEKINIRLQPHKDLLNSLGYSLSQ